jgi:hypothetical protein
MPVTLPPGRARLATKPSSTGSAPTTMTIGVALFAASIAFTDESLIATTTSTLAAAISRARLGKRATLPPA